MMYLWWNFIPAVVISEEYNERGEEGRGEERRGEATRAKIKCYYHSQHGTLQGQIQTLTPVPWSHR